jgi:putative tryptophan/tyrosine transport system substrate-binding protein
MRYRHQYWLYILLFTISNLLFSCGDRPKTYTIGVINLTSGLDVTVEGFKKSMTEFGYAEGENITYLYEGATNSIKTLDAVAQGLVEANVDLILSVTTPATQAAQRATAGTDIPVVFVPVTDPVAAGLVKSLRQPGGNMTGVTFVLQEGRRLEWLVHIASSIEKIYIPYNPDDRSAALALEMASVTAAELGIELITREARTPEEVIAAIEQIPEEADAVFHLPDSLFTPHVAELIEIANTRKLPTSGPSNASIQDGALMVYGTRHDATAKQAARLADQILSGIKPADLPVETAESFLAINLKTAKRIGLEISDEVLRQADTIIREHR